MTHKHDPAFLFKLSLCWRAIAAMAFVDARQLALFQKIDRARAAHLAELLEIWTRLAMFMLIAQVAALKPNCKEDEIHISHLRGIIGTLAMLCAFAAKVKRQCARGMGFFGAREAF